MSALYSLMIVDDERVIREGISQLIEWEQLGLTLLGTAADGDTAYDSIMKTHPDIVITDIKMPGMTGLELISLTRQTMPHIRFIVLSGHGEFEFATTAMQHGVKHYLLKPCNELEITEVLRQVVEELEEQRSSVHMIQAMEAKLAEALPHVKEQFLRDCLLNRYELQPELDSYKQLLGIREEHVRLLLYQLEGAFEYIHLYVLQQVCEAHLKLHKIILSSIIADKFAMVTEEADLQALMQAALDIQNELKRRYGLEVTLSISDQGPIEELSQAYRDVQKYLKQRFYLGESSIITSEADVQKSSSEAPAISLNSSPIVLAIKVGNREEVRKEFLLYFEQLRQTRGEMNVAISFCMELMITILREASLDEMNMNQIAPILQMSTLEEIHQYMLKLSLQIADLNYNAYASKNRQLIHNLLQLVHQNIENEALSLQWLAKEFFYMNVDYLGKLFRKETNEKFSQYLTRIRIQRAKELMGIYPDLKIYEIAEKSGFGTDPQYFSNLFKKFAGLTPLEYKTMVKAKK